MKELVEIGQVWEQTKGQYIGRRGKVVSYTNRRITLDPFKGLCKCPLKQRRTTMKMNTFIQQWKLYEE